MADLNAIVERVHRIGWLYQTGGTGLYLSLAARIPGVTRADIDFAVASRALRVLTTVRGCTMLVPAADVTLARAAGARAFAPTVQAILRSGELDEAGRDRLCDEVVDVLGFGTTSSAVLRAELAERAEIPALGPVGRKFGFSNALPLALRVLECWGRVERVPGRLDGDDYAWRRAPDDERENGPTGAALDLGLARRFLGWGGEGAAFTADDLSAWLTCGKRAGRALFDEAGGGSGDCAGFGAGVVYLPFRDPYLENRRGMSRLVAPEHLHARVDGWGKGTVAVGEAESLHHHAIVAQGRVVGIWEWADGQVVSGFFGEPPKDWAQAAEATGNWVRDQLGDVFIYAQDGARQRAGRVEIVRGLGVATT